MKQSAGGKVNRSGRETANLPPPTYLSAVSTTGLARFCDNPCMQASKTAFPVTRRQFPSRARSNKTAIGQGKMTQLLQPWRIVVIWLWRPDIERLVAVRSRMVRPAGRSIIEPRRDKSRVWNSWPTCRCSSRFQPDRQCCFGLGQTLADWCCSKHNTSACWRPV